MYGFSNALHLIFGPPKSPKIPTGIANCSECWRISSIIGIWEDGSSIWLKFNLNTFTPAIINSFISGILPGPRVATILLNQIKLGSSVLALFHLIQSPQDQKSGTARKQPPVSNPRGKAVIRI